MSVSGRSSLEQCALASGLLSEEQLDEVRASLRAAATAEVPPPDDRQLAGRLVEFGYLNAWQAQQLLQGRTKFTLGPYRIVDSLGQGGMGQVFKGEHDIMRRPVAIKVLPREKCTPEAIANFRREIQALARLNHRKLVRALDEGQDGKVYYLVTEFVPGYDLRKLVRRTGPLGMESAASIISQVAEGLQHAHEQGLIHRDVKPGNVIVTPDGEAKLLDLGLAGPVDGDRESDPRFGKIVGTADYLSPDHIASPRDPTAAWDIYSLGCTLYYAVTGKVPFPGGTTADKARAHCELRPLDPRRINHRLSDDFVDVIADMMAKDAMQRIQSAAEVIERLARWASQGISGEPAPPPQVWGALASRPVAVENVAPPTPLAAQPVPVVPAMSGQDANFPPRIPGPPPAVAIAPPLVPGSLPLPPVAPPPVVRRAPVPPVVPISDTVSDFGGTVETESGSGDSMSLIVETRGRWLWVIGLALGLPTTIALVVLVKWLLSQLW